MQLSNKSTTYMQVELQACFLTHVYINTSEIVKFEASSLNKHSDYLICRSHGFTYEKSKDKLFKI